MSIQNKPLQRRGFLRGALATAVLLPLGGALASCAGGGDSGTSAAPGGEVDPTKNPFGVAKTGALDAVIFKGGYGIDYVDFAGAIFSKNFPDVTVKISPSTDISQEMQPRFVGGTPPDLIDNSGAKSMGFSGILDQLEDLKSVTEANNLEGT
ncbi:MAG: carbohydrate ABC transporter, N-acetylglucosamine/diacetylchitobiose-binding protein, partial [Arthrobacter sp.]|nr:carbohydrate ABC transporter, N-acetylglucosamine/diacetylchitobiose-binding protein [Arthrobacter sp.]